MKIIKSESRWRFGFLVEGSRVARCQGYIYFERNVALGKRRSKPNAPSHLLVDNEASSCLSITLEQDLYGMHHE